MNTRSSQTPASATQLKMLQKSAQSAQTIFARQLPRRTLKQDYWTRTFVSSHLIIEVIHLTAMSQQF